MAAGGWKTVIIDGCCSIGYTQGCLKVERDSGTEEIPLGEIKTVILESLQIRASVYLLNEFRKTNY